jgi:hypothetical protein
MPQEALTASPAAEQLRCGFRWLRYRSGLEAVYRAEQFQSDLKFLRASLAIVGVSLLIVFQIEHAVMPAIGAALPRISVGPICHVLLSLPWRTAATGRGCSFSKTCGYRDAVEP